MHTIHDHILTVVLDLPLGITGYSLYLANLLYSTELLLYESLLHSSLLLVHVEVNGSFSDVSCVVQGLLQ